MKRLAIEGGFETTKQMYNKIEMYVQENMGGCRYRRNRKCEFLKCVIGEHFAHSNKTNLGGNEGGLGHLKSWKMAT